MFALQDLCRRVAHSQVTSVCPANDHVGSVGEYQVKPSLTGLGGFVFRYGDGVVRFWPCEVGCTDRKKMRIEECLANAFVICARPSGDG